MPWNENDYPDSWKNLDSDVRKKAIEIGNALISKEGYEEGRAIAIATDRAKRSELGEEDQTAYHLTTHEKGWQLKQNGKERAIFVEETKSALEEKAKPYVAKNKGKLVVHQKDGSVDQTLYE